MTNRLSKIQAIVLGFIVLMVFSILIWQLFKTRITEDGIVVTTKFSEVRGLRVSDRVHYRGVDVGEVISVVPHPGYVIVTLRLSQKMNMVGDDSKVKIENESLLKEQIVKIIEGEKKDLKTGDVLTAIEIKDPIEHLEETTQKLGVVLSQLSKNKFIANNQLYDDVIMTVDELKKTITETKSNVKNALDSVQQNTDAIKKLPIIRNYISKDPITELTRPEMKKVRKVFAEEELFQINKSVNFEYTKYFGTAILTKEGKQKLDGLVKWLNDYKLGEIAIVSIGLKKDDHNGYVQLTNYKQSEAVKNYLLSKAVQKSWNPFNKKEIKIFGFGAATYCDEMEKLPDNRTEILVFLPVK